ncbi:MAG: hypothetical protein AAF738_09135, partial [Bacteroidota bacterium]
MPDNETVCAGNVPLAVMPTVTDDCSAAIDIRVQLQEDTVGTTNLCNGSMLRRTWSAIDERGNESTSIQIITIEPDNEAPVANFVIMPDTVFCENSAFENWVEANLDSLRANATDNCGIRRIDKNGPSNFQDCGTILVEFYVEDTCGNLTTLTSTYTIQDTVAPVFLTTLPDTVISACALRGIDTLAVSVMDNCVDVRDIELLITETPNFVGDDCGTILLTRTYEAKDGCGNSTFLSHTITVRDEEGPEFDLPADMTVNCGIDFNDLNVLGTVSNVSDNCPSGNNSITYADSLSGVGGALVIRRFWTVTDVCENSRTKVQTINVLDSLPPAFDPPLDVDISCDDLNNLSVTGEPSMLSDNCDPAPVVTYEDIINPSAGGCTSGAGIIRRWRIEDNAGNFTTSDQEIRIQDDFPPIFVRSAMDMNVSCLDTTRVEMVFDAWVARMGDAFAMDNCTADSNLVWIAYNTGTTDTPSLPMETCPSDSIGIFRTQTVDFIVSDVCGNRAATRASFNVVDNVAPVFAFCPADTVLAATGNSCSANFMFIPPRVVEQCGATVGNYRRSVSANIFSDDPGNMDVPVNEVRLSFPFFPSQDFPSTSATLTLELKDIDADQAPEYFLIYLEDGTLIGRTANSNARCGNSITTLRNITSTQLVQ